MAFSIAGDDAATKKNRREARRFWIRCCAWFVYALASPAAGRGRYAK